jgi:hypothetical protein
MAIVAVRRLNELQSSLDFNPQATQGSIKRTRTEYYQVVSNSLTEAADTIETASAGGVSIPMLGGLYNSLANVIATKITSKRDKEHPYHWIVQVDYTTLPPYNPQTPPPQNRNDPTDPRNQFADIACSWVKRQLPMYVDYGGNPVVNSVNESVDPPPMYNLDVLQVRITRSERWLPLRNMRAFGNTINNQPFWGWPVGCAWMLPITASSDYQQLPNGQCSTYFKVTYTVELTTGQQIGPVGPTGFFDDWGIRPIDRSAHKLMEQVAASGGSLTWTLQPVYSGSVQANLVPVVITDALGIPKARPSNLNGMGAPLPPTSPPGWAAFAANAPPPNGGRMTRNNNIVDGYVPARAVDFNTLQDADGNAIPDLLAAAGLAKVRW